MATQFWGTKFQKLMQAVSRVYEPGSDPWIKIQKYGIYADDAEKYLADVPYVQLIKNMKGDIVGYNVLQPTNISSVTGTAINSNVPADIITFDVPATTGLETVAGETAKQLTFKAGMKEAGHFIFGKVLPIVGAVSTGLTLGKTVDSLLYKVNPNFWNEHDMEYLNPDTWGEIIGNDTAGGKFFNFIFGTSDGKKMQAYMDEKAMAYMSLYLKNKGAFEPESKEIYENDDIKFLNLSKYIKFPVKLSPQIVFYKSNGAHDTVYKIITNAEKVAFFGPDRWGSILLVIASLEPFSVTDIDTSGTTSPDVYNIDNAYKLNEKSFYFFNSRGRYTNNTGVINPDILSGDWNYGQIAYALLYGDTKSKSNIEGIGTQAGAKTPDLSGATTVDDALAKLKEQYPDMFSKAVTQDVVQPDGSVITHTYVPVSMPELDPDGNPVSSPSTQAKPEVDPDTATDPLIQTILDIVQPNTPSNPPETGDGNTPVVTTPVASASSLYAIYNPTLDQINQFGAWLWSDNFIEQIKKLFSDPMQAIIGLHKVYATPATHGTANIKVGYLDSGVPSKIVSNQYTDIDCGTVSLSEYFYNVFDYAPYTSVNLYLPFIGIVGLDVADVMRSSIHIVYHVDVLSGACLAEVKVIRDSFGGTLYQYAGNASVTLPISSGSYMGIVSSVAGIAGGIAGTIASGGSALPLLASSAGSLLNAHTNVEHSGGFSGNVGAMGAKIPYLIISRPQVEMANNFERYIGYPANTTTKLSACSGYVKVVESHLENINATDTELNEIDSLLKGGIII